jgi:hypothetical protein
MIISPWARRGSERSIMTAKARSSNEAILECDIPPDTGEQSFLMQIRHGGGVKALSGRTEFCP